MSETKVGKAEVRVSVKLAESGKYYCTLQYFINGEAMVINQYHQEKAIVWGPYDRPIKCILSSKRTSMRPFGNYKIQTLKSPGRNAGSKVVLFESMGQKMWRERLSS